MIKIAVNEIEAVKELLKKTENGESCILTEAGEPIAEILPFKVKKPIWKRKNKKIQLPPGTKPLSEIMREMQNRMNKCLIPYSEGLEKKPEELINRFQLKTLDAVQAAALLVHDVPGDFFICADENIRYVGKEADGQFSLLLSQIQLSARKPLFKH